MTKPLPFYDGQFDTIILSDVLEHIPEPEKLFNEISRVLSKGGKLIMNVPFFYRIHEEPNDYYRYTEYALRMFVKKSNLTLVKLDSIGGVPEILADVLAKNFQHVPWLGVYISSFIQWLASSFINISLGKKISDKTKGPFPLGYFLIAQKIK